MALVGGVDVDASLCCRLSTCKQAVVASTPFCRPHLMTIAPLPTKAPTSTTSRNWTTRLRASWPGSLRSSAERAPVAGMTPNRCPAVSKAVEASSTSTDPSPLSENERRKLRKAELYERRKNAMRDIGTSVSRRHQRLPLEAYIYAQAARDGCPLPPPPGVVMMTTGASERSTGSSVKTSIKASAKFPSVYAAMDPRVHWNRARSMAWHEAKKQEIQARGGRKANCQKAAERMAAQRRRARMLTLTRNGDRETPSEKPSEWQGELPKEVQRNEAWMRLLQTFARDENERCG